MCIAVMYLGSVTRATPKSHSQHGKTLHARPRCLLQWQDETGGFNPSIQPAMTHHQGQTSATLSCLRSRTWQPAITLNFTIQELG